ncbi:MAG: NAD(P)/FAD-dependent oxidoreductase [Mycobacterium sp.]
MDLLATEPIVDDDDLIAAALSRLSVSALTASVVQITGDPAYVRGPIRPRQFVQNEFQGSLDADEQDQLRRDALKAICAWRDAGCPPPAALPPDVIREVMDWVACEPVPADTVALYAEEMDLAGENPRAIKLPAGAALPEGFSVLIVGLGASGLLAGIRLREAGIPFEIVEKNAGVGGAWFENTYPGCRVDVASHFYSYSFERNNDFSQYYTRQPELQAYFRKTMAERGIGEYVTWNTEVTRAVWDEDTARWIVTLDGPEGVQTREAAAVISGVGVLSRPLIPDIEGLDRFTGPVFHAAQWDHSVDLCGKRVALVGAGASGFQIGPAIVDDVAALTVFQRTPQWMAPNPRYHDDVTNGEKWAMRHLPGYARWYRFMLMWQSSDKLLELVRAEPDWPDFPHTANAASAARREIFVKWIQDQVGDDPELAAKVTPTYPPMAKRMLQDNGSWLRCLKRDHVELVNDHIVAADEHGIITAAGRYDVDVIVLATGFRASEVLCPMEVVGRGGVLISELWDGKPKAYNGVSVPGFPNFFMMQGPGTGLAHAGSVIFTLECQMRYIGEALVALANTGCREIEPTTPAYERYNDELQHEVSTLMWGHPSIAHSWYKAADGGVYVLCPFGNTEYWRRTREVVAEDHLLR